MKVPTKNKEKKRSRLFRWFANISANLSKRYVNDCHPVFMQYLAVNNIATASIWNDARSKRFEEIWKLISSDKYKKYFYNAVDYDYKRGESPKPLPLKWYVRAFDKVVYWISKAYVFLFEKELYKKIKTFETVSSGVVSLTKRMDEYIASTTSLQRLSRMQALGIISNESFRDDFDVLVNRVSPDEIEKRNQETLSAYFMASKVKAETEKKLPQDIIKLLRRE
jgi:hypothetical protein